MTAHPGGARRQGGPAKGGKFRKQRRKVCIFSAEKIEKVDYKMLINNRYRSKLLTERGKVVPRRTTGTTAKYQRQVATAVKRARHMALLPFVAE
jgi:small subunit ribosomal protein S18